MAEFTHCGLEVGIKDTEQLNDITKRIEDESGGDYAKLAQAAKTVAEENIIAKKIAKRNAAINVRKTAEIIDYVTRVYGDKPELGLQAILVGTNRARKGSRNSAAALQNSKSGAYTQGFLADIEKTGHWKDFVSGEYDDEIAEAIWKAGKGEKISGHSDVARAIAPIIEKWNEHARIEANRAGAWIGKQEGYIVQQSHDMMKIRDASRRSGGEFTRDEAQNFKAWKDFILPLLDTDKTFKGERDTDKFLKSVWEGLASGVHMMTTGGGDSATVPAGFASLAKRMSHDRVLHFSDGQNWTKYNKTFGNGSLRESMLYGLERSANNTAIMESLGANPKMVLDNAFNSLQKVAAKKGVKQRTDFANKREVVDRWMAEIDGSVNIPANAGVARFGANVRALQSMSKLGGAVISSITDLHNVAGEMRYQGQGFLSGYKAALEGLSGTSQEKKEILGMLGVTMRGMAGDVVHRFSAADDLGGKMSGAMRTYFKYNGLTWWTDSLRSGVSLSFSKNMADNMGKSFGDLSSDLSRTLDLFAIDDRMWDMMRKVKPETADGESFLTPEMARKISDKDLESYLSDGTKKPSDAAKEDLRREIETKFRNYFVDRTEYAVIEPDARVRAISKMGTRPGTASGELMRFMMQFKSFPTAMFLKPLARDVYGRGVEADTFMGAMSQALRSGNGEMLALSHTIVMSSVLGYVAMSAKDMVKGRSPRDPLDPKTWAASAVQGGGLGIYGDFVFGDYNRFGRSFLSSLAGPTIGQIDDAAGLWSSIKKGDDVSANLMRTIVSNTPYANLFYTRMALDYLILYRMQEAMNPGYLKRMEKRVEKQNAQKFMVKPSEYVEPF